MNRISSYAIVCCLAGSLHAMQLTKKLKVNPHTQYHVKWSNEIFEVGDRDEQAAEACKAFINLARQWDKRCHDGEDQTKVCEEAMFIVTRLGAAIVCSKYDGVPKTWRVGLEKHIPVAATVCTTIDTIAPPQNFGEFACTENSRFGAYLSAYACSHLYNILRNKDPVITESNQLCNKLTAE